MAPIYFYQHYTGDPRQQRKARKNNKKSKNEKQETKVLFAYDITVYIENLEESTDFLMIL